MYKPVVVLLVVFAVAMSQPAPEATKPIKDTSIEHAKPESKPNDITLGQIVDRLTEAVRMTIKEERASIGKAIKAFKEAGNQSIKASLEAALTGLDMFLVVPKFGKNILLTGN